MVIAEKMTKPTVQISVSESESSEIEESEQSDIDESGAEKSASQDEHDLGEHSNEDDSLNTNVESNSSDDEKNALVTNEGWADSVAKILGSSKPKNKKTLVLSRAKKHADVVKTNKEVKPDFEVIGEGKEEKPEVKVEKGVTQPPAKRKKHDKPSLRVKPNILEKDREKLLSKIATKGVVQLFNAVRNQQKSLEKEVERDDLTEAKKEKILKKFDKRAFLDTLMGNTKSVVIDDSLEKPKDEVKNEEAPKWKALRDDFMMGAKMKDWDKESVDE